MGDADIRKAAETSNRMLDRPVNALKEGGIAQGSTVGKTLLEPAAHGRGPGPGPGHRREEVVGQACPSTTRSRTTSASTSPRSPRLNGILHSLRSGQDEPDPRQRRAQPGEDQPLGRDGPAEPVHLRRREARREALGQDRGAWA
ncbi:hypothetical protein [Nocardioides convexus]|uniref:hypothetical protein n=1 Tax=Nocardioides convexus TaxID=2712224 RepID=UPI002418601F|nr:hypothetical protein [Nocardioides convexus]